MAVAPPSTPTLDATKKSKKQNKGEKAESEAQVTQEQGEKKRKKKHRGEDTVEQEVAIPVQAADAMERPKKKRKSEPTASNTSEDTPPTSNEAALTEPSSSVKPKREKRPKRPKDKSAKFVEPKVEPPVSIKDKIRIVDIPVQHTNPLTDESLPELSQRGLAYAYQYAQHVSLPSDSERATHQAWKFNKGRQNWVLRNVTNPTTIPDPYLSLAMIYVTSIKGGALDSLKKTCKMTMREAKATKSSEQTPEQLAESKKPTDAQASSEEPGESTSKKVAFAVGTVEPPSSAPTKEERSRAKAIIRVLKGKLKPDDV
ncbi:hypothetical protein BDV93DRAFT_518181 [Ceratobasidium sp. AG-I]|nr:hypothetical protein BDV93DRAFT_518181 [Ceratobasidium sp. AG-I]